MKYSSGGSVEGQKKTQEPYKVWWRSGRNLKSETLEYNHWCSLVSSQNPSIGIRNNINILGMHSSFDWPNIQTTYQATEQPTNQPINQPTKQTTKQPTTQPNKKTTTQPTKQPTD